MKSLLNTSVALGLLLAAPLTTYPAVSASAPTVHKALAPLWAAPAAAAPYSAHHIDGLSRNPDDCAKYGCIDNGAVKGRASRGKGDRAMPGRSAELYGLSYRPSAGRGLRCRTFLCPAHTRASQADNVAVSNPNRRGDKLSL